MLPLILALAGGYLIYESLEPQKMESGGEIPASEVKVGDIVYLKIDSLRTRGYAHNPKYYYGNKDVKAIIHKISKEYDDFYIFQISKANNKGEEVKLPQGQLGISYMRSDFYYPEEKKMAMGGTIDDQMKDTMSKRDDIEKEIRQLMTEDPKDLGKIEALQHEYESLGKAYKKLNKQKLDEMRGGLKFK